MWPNRAGLSYDLRPEVSNFEEEIPLDDMDFLQRTYDELKTLSTSKSARRAFLRERNPALKSGHINKLVDS